MSAASGGGRSDVGIRPYAPDDFPLLERLLGDPAMTVHLGGPESPKALAARHKRYLEYDPATHGLFTITVSADETPAGWVGYWQMSWHGRQAWECGWHVLPEHQGAGVAIAATRLMLERARSQGVGGQMHAFPSVDNLASNALCEKLGFELLGKEEIEYPKGHLMTGNHWRLELGAVGSDGSDDGRTT